MWRGLKESEGPFLIMMIFMILCPRSLSSVKRPGRRCQLARPLISVRIAGFWAKSLNPGPRSSDTRFCPDRQAGRDPKQCGCIHRCQRFVSMLIMLNSAAPVSTMGDSDVISDTEVIYPVLRPQFYMDFLRIFCILFAWLWSTGL